ncbi:NUDIX hydrolase [Patescibacteria group bacterium]|nr:NUDIX hydrolase [Patescibacteria group bacterium]
MSDNKKIKLQVGVKIFLKNKNNKYLILHRNIEKYPDNDGNWDIVGGRIDRGISLLENLQREVKEETQLDLENNPQLIGAQDILRVKGLHVVRLTYIANIEGDPTLSDEHDRFKWLSIEGIKKLIAENRMDIYSKELIEKGLLK